MNDSLETLLADGIIEAVIGQLKTGKEAEVWLVQHAGEVVAAKLYKERHERNFRNNVGYREGREVRNSRTRRAMEKGSRFGQAATDDAWKSAESDSLYKLHALGVRVPTPVLFYEGILLMELVLDADGRPAPRLVEAPPTTPEEAQALYLDLRSQVVSMLCADLIHGDLSPYNILMSWQGAIIIDFPQTVAAARNNRAEFYFRRDLDNVRNFLAGIAPRLYDAEGDTGEIWNAYVRRELTPDFTPRGNFREAPRKGGLKGPRDARQGLVPEPARLEQVPVAPQAAMTPEEAVEAELRELEALVLKQGGGERGKPAAAPPPRGGRNRSGGGRPPPRAGGNRPPGAGGNGPRPPMAGSEARPPPNGQRAGNGSQPQAGGPRGGGNGRPGPNEQRVGGNPGARPYVPRGGNPPGARSNEPRGGSNTGARFNEQRGGPSQGTHFNEQRNGSNAGARVSEPRGGPPPDARFSEPRGRNNPGARFSEPRGDSNAGAQGNEPRMSSPSNGQRPGNGRPARNDSRPGGNGRPPRNEQGPGGNGRPPRNDSRPGGNGFAATSSEPGDGAGAPPRDAPRGNGYTSGDEPRGGNTPGGERRGGPGRQQPQVETRPAPPPGPAANNLREPRSGGPGNGPGSRQPRQGPNRGGPRAPRASGPQVSFVGRPASSSDPGPHETGS
jgi:RIO kinase 1